MNQASEQSKQTAERKVDHVRINLEETVDSRLSSGLEAYRFSPLAIPELNLSEVDIDQSFLGMQLASPILISSMTGGSEGLTDINRHLAEAAEERGILMGLGSQRAAIESEVLASSFQVRRFAPKAKLLANLGAVQLNYGYGVEQCQRAVEMVEAEALILHFNAIQEAVQPEGDTDWSGLLRKVEDVVSRLSVPVIAKEVGWGFSALDIERLAGVGVSAIDVAGAGGTSWSEVEKYRADDPIQAEVAGAFIDWGTPTASSISHARKVAPMIPIIASGGLRNGIDIAKCIALGASIGGMAGPFLRAASHSTQAVIDQIEILERTIRIAMFGIGAPSIHALRDTPRLERVAP